MLLQTRHVLHRPYCLLELLTAIDFKVPIVGGDTATAPPPPPQRPHHAAPVPPRPCASSSAPPHWAGAWLVPVVVASPRVDERYDFEDAAHFLQNLDTLLEERTPGASQILAEHGYGDLKQAGLKLGAVIPKVISLQLNFAASARVLSAMKEDVRDEIRRQQQSVTAIEEAAVRPYLPQLHR